MSKKIIIEYCQPCRFEKQAADLASEINAQFGDRAGEVIIEPTNLIGSFEVSIDGEVVYSKIKKGRLPHPGEVEQLLMTRIYK